MPDVSIPPHIAPPTEDLSGLGPMPHAHGVAFRVWAPHAEAVSVIGSFNDWQPAANPLEREPNGCWFANVAAVKPGDEYRYHLTFRGDSFTRIDPRARAVTDSKGNALVHDPEFDWDGDDFTAAPLDRLVLYELHVGTFNAADGHGTLASAGQRLGHLRDLGVAGITLMPVTEFVGDRGWGYDMSHLYAVESSYGGPKALKEFVKAAHRHGIAVFLDVVYNHFGVEDNILWRFDGWHEGKYGGIYFYQDDLKADTPWGPRPDFGRREVRDYVIDNVLYWLGEYHIDGLRVDGTFHMRTASRTERGEGPHLEDGWNLLQEMTDAVRKRFPRAILTAEDMRGDPVMTRPVSAGGAGFHCQWSDKFAKTSRMSPDPVDRAAVMNFVIESLVVRYNDDPFQRIIFSESHDNAGKDGRIPAVADPKNPEGLEAVRRAIQAQAIVFTAPGVPQFFQGQELLDPESFEFPHPHPLDLGRAERLPGVLKFFRDLIGLRKNEHGTTAGLTGPHIEIVHANADAGVLAWRRWKHGGPGDDVLVIANFSGDCLEDHPIAAPAPGRWSVRLNTESPDYAAGLGTVSCPDTMAAEAADGGAHRLGVTLGPWGILLLSQDA